MTAQTPRDNCRLSLKRARQNLTGLQTNLEGAVIQEANIDKNNSAQIAQDFARDILPKIEYLKTYIAERLAKYS